MNMMAPSAWDGPATLAIEAAGPRQRRAAALLLLAAVYAA